MRFRSTNVTTKRARDQGTTSRTSQTWNLTPSVSDRDVAVPWFCRGTLWFRVLDFLDSYAAAF